MKHVVKNAGVQVRPNSYSVILEGKAESGADVQLRMKIDHHSVRKLADILPFIGSRVSCTMPIIELVLSLPIDVLIDNRTSPPGSHNKEYSARQVIVRISDNVVQFHLLTEGGMVLVNPYELQDVIWSLLAQMGVPCTQQDKLPSIYLGDAKFARAAMVHFPNSMANSTCLVIGDEAAVLADYIKTEYNEDDPAIGKYNCIDRNVRVFVPDENRSVWRQVVGNLSVTSAQAKFIETIKEFKIQ